MSKLFLSFLLFISAYGHACICVPLVPISKDLCEKYDVIFYGTIDSIGACDEKERSVAYFTITELYKGKTEKHVKIYFDCVSECLMTLVADEEWIIYTRYSKFDYLEISMCEHSRKKPKNGEEDIYLMDSKRTFDEELKFLKSTLEVQATTESVILNNSGTELGRQNEQPSSFGKIALLSVSLLVMGIVFFITRKKK